MSDFGKIVNLSDGILSENIYEPLRNPNSVRDKNYDDAVEAIMEESKQIGKDQGALAIFTTSVQKLITSIEGYAGPQLKNTHIRALYLIVADALIKQGRYAEASKCLETLITNDPSEHNGVFTQNNVFTLRRLYPSELYWFSSLAKNIIDKGSASEAFIKKIADQTAAMVAKPDLKDKLAIPIGRFLLLLANNPLTVDDSAQKLLEDITKQCAKSKADQYRWVAFEYIRNILIEHIAGQNGIYSGYAEIMDDEFIGNAVPSQKSIESLKTQPDKFSEVRIEFDCKRQRFFMRLQYLKNTGDFVTALDLINKYRTKFEWDGDYIKRELDYLQGELNLTAYQSAPEHEKKAYLDAAVIPAPENDSERARNYYFEAGKFRATGNLTEYVKKNYEIVGRDFKYIATYDIPNKEKEGLYFNTLCALVEYYLDENNPVDDPAVSNHDKAMKAWAVLKGLTIGGVNALDQACQDFAKRTTFKDNDLRILFILARTMPEGGKTDTGIDIPTAEAIYKKIQVVYSPANIAALRSPNSNYRYNGYIFRYYWEATLLLSFLYADKGNTAQTDQEITKIQNEYTTQQKMRVVPKDLAYIEKLLSDASFIVLLKTLARFKDEGNWQDGLAAVAERRAKINAKPKLDKNDIKSLRELDFQQLEFESLRYTNTLVGSVDHVKPNMATIVPLDENDAQRIFYIKAAVAGFDKDYGTLAGLINDVMGNTDDLLDGYVVKTGQNIDLKNEQFRRNVFCAKYELYSNEDPKNTQWNVQVANSIYEKQIRSRTQPIILDLANRQSFGPDELRMLFIAAKKEPEGPAIYAKFMALYSAPSHTYWDAVMGLLYYNQKIKLYNVDLTEALKPFYLVVNAYKTDPTSVYLTEKYTEAMLVKANIDLAVDKSKDLVNVKADLDEVGKLKLNTQQYFQYIELQIRYYEKLKNVDGLKKIQDELSKLTEQTSTTRLLQQLCQANIVSIGCQQAKGTEGKKNALGKAAVVLTSLYPTGESIDAAYQTMKNGFEKSLFARVLMVGASLLQENAKGRPAALPTTEDNDYYENALQKIILNHGADLDADFINMANYRLGVDYAWQLSDKGQVGLDIAQQIAEREIKRITGQPLREYQMLEILGLIAQEPKKYADLLEAYGLLMVCYSKGENDKQKIALAYSDAIIANTANILKYGQQYNQQVIDAYHNAANYYAYKQGDTAGFKKALELVQKAPDYKIKAAYDGITEIVSPAYAKIVTFCSGKLKSGNLVANIAEQYKPYLSLNDPDRQYTQDILDAADLVVMDAEVKVESKQIKDSSLIDANYAAVINQSSALSANHKVYLLARLALAKARIYKVAQQYAQALKEVEVILTNKDLALEQNKLKDEPPFNYFYADVLLEQAELALSIGDPSQAGIVLEKIIKELPDLKLKSEDLGGYQLYANLKQLRLYSMVKDYDSAKKQLDEILVKIVDYTPEQQKLIYQTAIDLYWRFGKDAEINNLLAVVTAPEIKAVIIIKQMTLANEAYGKAREAKADEAAQQVADKQVEDKGKEFLALNLPKTAGSPALPLWVEYYLQQASRFGISEDYKAKQTWITLAKDMVALMDEGQEKQTYNRLIDLINAYTGAEQRNWVDLKLGNIKDVWNPDNGFEDEDFFVQGKLIDLNRMLTQAKYKDLDEQLKLEIAQVKELITKYPKGYLFEKLTAYENELKLIQFKFARTILTKGYYDTIYPAIDKELSVITSQTRDEVVFVERYQKEKAQELKIYNSEELDWEKSAADYQQRLDNYAKNSASWTTWQKKEALDILLNIALGEGYSVEVEQAIKIMYGFENAQPDENSKSDLVKYVSQFKKSFTLTLTPAEQAYGYYILLKIAVVNDDIARVENLYKAYAQACLQDKYYSEADQLIHKLLADYKEFLKNKKDLAAKNGGR